MRLVRLGLRHKMRLAAALTITVVMQVMAIAQLVSAGLAIDVLRREADANAPQPQWPLGLEPGEGTTLLAILIYAAIAVFVFSVLRAVGYYLGRLTDELLAQAIIVELRDELYKKLNELPFSFYDTNDSGTIINRVTGDVQSVRAFVQGVLLRAFTAVISLIVFLSALFSIHVWLSLACLSFVVLQGVIMLNFARHARPAFQLQRKLLDGLTTRLSEAVQGVRVIRAFGREQQQIQQFDAQSADARDQRYSIWRLMANHMPFVQGSAWLSVAVLIGYGGHLVQVGPAAGGIALGSIWVFFGLLRSLAGQLEPLIRVAGQMPEALTASERIFAILDTDPEIISPTTPRAPSANQTRATGRIELRNVSFGYGEFDDVLHNVNLTIEPGETVAIVGPTGSGKTTLLQLIQRFYDPRSGQVLVDGVDVREWDLVSLRRSIGIVFQEAYLFSNSIRSNIAFGDPDADMERITQHARCAAADGFIESLDQKYETIVGERGVTLSGGERQRISLARALLSEPSILLLDDAMSAVDPSTESFIQSKLDAFGGTRSVLVIAHRLSTLRRADRVVVLDQGEIVACGTHDELMRTDGHYREAALVQLAHEREELEESAAP